MYKAQRSVAWLRLILAWQGFCFKSQLYLRNPKQCGYWSDLLRGIWEKHDKSLESQSGLKEPVSPSWGTLSCIVCSVDEVLQRLAVAGDEWKALVLFALAAEQGSPAAQHNLGFTLQRTKAFDMPGRQAKSPETPSKAA